MDFRLLQLPYTVRTTDIFFTEHYRAAGALPQTAEDTIGRNPCVQSSVRRRPTITMLFRARLRVCPHTRSFLNSKFGMTLVHLKIEKYRISRPRPIDGSDLVLTEWTPHRKSTHKMKNRSWVWWFPVLSTALIFGLRRPHAVRGWF